MVPKIQSQMGEFGDRNTKYFHGVTTIRRWKNHITALQNEQGTWVNSAQLLEELATKYFKNLFTSEGNVSPYVHSGLFPALEAHKVAVLSNTVTDEEIGNVIRSIGAYKAPGPDGYQAVFYQSQWRTIGPSLCRMIKDMWDSPWKIKDINATYLALIPKTENVCNMKQLRPIGLCNVAYKVITKLISNRL